MNGKALEAFDELFGPYSLTQKQRDELKAIVRNALSGPTVGEIIELIKRIQAQNIMELNLKLASGSPFDAAPYYEKDKLFYAILSAIREMADVDTSGIAQHGNGKFTECDHQSSLRERGEGEMNRQKINNAPPLGIMPKTIWQEQRRVELAGAIQRYLEANLPLLPEWITEWNEGANK